MDLPLMPPRWLFPSINQACNQRCLHCRRWLSDEPEPDARIPITRTCEIIEEFSELTSVADGGGNVVICGGEPLLAGAGYFEICAACRKAGLHSYSVTNGTLLPTDAKAECLLRDGPDEITVSLDSPDEEIHDRLRGCRGAFRAAVRAVRLLVAARRALGLQDKRRIYVMGLICDVNYRDLDRFYDFVLNDLGADKLKVNLLQPTCEIAQGEPDQFFSEHARVNPDEFMDILRKCDEKHALGLDPIWIGQMGMYYRSIWRSYNLVGGWGSGMKTREHICNSYDRNIMVDLQGVARLCFSTRFPGMFLREPGDMRRFWESPETEAIRERMCKCNEVCAISHSTRRVNATLKGAR